MVSLFEEEDLFDFDDERTLLGLEGLFVHENLLKSDNRRDEENLCDPTPGRRGGEDTA
jgi:hypothetical protein